MQVKNTGSLNKNNIIDVNGNQNNVDNSNKIIKNIYPVSSKVKNTQTTNRPYLQDREGKFIRCFGVIAGKFSEVSSFYTVVNLVDQHGVYVADHVQLDLKENEFDYSKQETKFSLVRLTGYVNKYQRADGTFDFEIDLSEPVEFFNDRYYNEGEVIYLEDIDIPQSRIDYIQNWVSKANSNELYDILDKLQIELNRLCIDFPSNFIFDYIINSYTLNTAVYDMYKNGIDRNKLVNDAIIDLLVLLGSTIFTLKSTDSMIMTSILKIISEYCNSVQGVVTYTDSSKFKKFCSNKLNINSKKKFHKAWKAVQNRRKNFGDNTGKIDKNYIALLSFIILNDYID